MNWQPIETAPKTEGLVVLGSDGAKVYPIEWTSYWDGWIFCHQDADLVRPKKVTHWMPLPEPPENES